MVCAANDAVGHPDALDYESVAKPHFVARKEPEVPFLRSFLVIVALDPELPREGHLPLAPVRLLRMVRYVAELFLAGRIVLDDQLDGIKHCHPARRNFVQVLAHAILEDAEV